MKILDDGRINCRVKIVGSYQGIQFEYVDSENEEGSQYYSQYGDPSTHWWSEGNFGCDCNRKEFLPPGLKALFEKNHSEDANACGETIMIDEIIPLDYPEGKPLILNETKSRIQRWTRRMSETSAEKVTINLANYIDPKCKECYGRGIVRQLMNYKGEMYPANLMCTCVERTVKKMAKTDATINVTMLLPQILEAFRREQEKMEMN